MHTDYTGQGVDQLQDVINKIKSNPEDRRIILSAWNPIGMMYICLQMENYCLYLSSKMYVVGTQKDCLNKYPQHMF